LSPYGDGKLVGYLSQGKFAGVGAGSCGLSVGCPRQPYDWQAQADRHEDGDRANIQVMVTAHKH